MQGFYGIEASTCSFIPLPNCMIATQSGFIGTRRGLRLFLERRAWVRPQAARYADSSVRYSAWATLDDLEVNSTNSTEISTSSSLVAAGESYSDGSAETSGAWTLISCVCGYRHGCICAINFYPGAGLYQAGGARYCRVYDDIVRSRSLYSIVL